MALQRYEAPSFSPDETAFLQHYAKSLDRVDAMKKSGLAAALQLNPDDENQLEHVATGVIRKAERLSLADIATAIGADSIAMVRRIWDLCNSPEGHEAIKGLQLLARIHGVWTEKLGGSRQAVQIVLGQAVDAKAVSPPSGLPFTIDVATG